MAEIGNPSEICQLHFLLRGIKPPVWRRILIRSQSTIADLPYILPIAFPWTDSHLQRLVMRGKEYGMDGWGCTTFRTDARPVRWADFHFRVNARFRYEYDFRDAWQHPIRLEAVSPSPAGKVYPVCIAGARAARPEDCGGPWGYMEWMDHQELNLARDDLERIDDVLERVVQAKGDEKLCDVLGDVEDLREAVERVKAYTAFRPDRFERRTVNGRLKQYAAGNDAGKEHGRSEDEN